MSERARNLRSELTRLLTIASAAPWRPLLAERVHLRLCNRLCAIGIHDTMTELNFLFDNVTVGGGDFLEIFSLPSGALVDMELTPRHSKTAHPLIPCAIVIHQDKAGGLVDIRFYFDPGSVFNRPASVKRASPRAAKPFRPS